MLPDPRAPLSGAIETRCANHPVDDLIPAAGSYGYADRTVSQTFPAFRQDRVVRRHHPAPDDAGGPGVGEFPLVGELPPRLGNADATLLRRLLVRDVATPLH